MQLACPLCTHPLSHCETHWQCDNHHSFDIAKQGYVNLLPVQHKKSKQPGDSNEMVMARSQFLDSQHYQPTANLINQTVKACLSNHAVGKAALVDAGCGEGYYTANLHQSLIDENIEHDLIGVDISKFAVRAAAKRAKTIQWIVGNSNNIPINDHSADVVISMFSPLIAEEFYRCLKPQGLLLIASTGPDHLIELREIIYDDVNEKVLEPQRTLGHYFHDEKPQSVQHKVTLSDTNAIANLFAMTPHYWRASSEKKQRIAQLDTLSLSIDIRIHRFVAKAGSTLC